MNTPLSERSIKNHPPRVVVLDAFGTIAHLANPTRPYARLRDILLSHGCDTTNFARNAMTQPSNFGRLAEMHGIELSMSQVGLLEDLLSKDLEHMRLAPEVAQSLSILLGEGMHVVIGSNLAEPYGMMLRQLLRAQGIEVGKGPRDGQLGAAFSYEVGFVKPEPEFYRYIEESLKEVYKAAALQERGTLQGRDILMVGDKPLEDQKGPSGAGWQVAPARKRAGENLHCVWPDMVRSILVGAPT